MAEFFTILISAMTVVGFVLVIASFVALGRSK
ncbi:hypothetical protein FB463_000163 [Frigoribacterium faeni]|uniref:Uncharacterized protein n=1 Tax=Frigoribacterium faeni TaxID=145483 RepID=A0A7W3JFQ2_9MICO|nr:hypothetical protein [Frigoribacterium faeni]